MLIQLAAVTARRGAAKNSAADALTKDYVERAARMIEVEAELFATEQALLAAAERSAGQAGRAAAHLALFDSRGESMTSERFAAWLGRLRDDGAQRLMLAIGPADGWSSAARTRANRTVSLGAMTMPHELARAVAAEQIYRALTILAGHPYHSGH